MPLIIQRLVHGRWLQLILDVSSTNAANCTSNISGWLLEVLVVTGLGVVGRISAFCCVSRCFTVGVAGSGHVHWNHGRLRGCSTWISRKLHFIPEDLAGNDNDETDDDDADNEQKTSDNGDCDDYIRIIVVVATLN